MRSNTRKDEDEHEQGGAKLSQARWSGVDDFLVAWRLAGWGMVPPPRACASHFPGMGGALTPGTHRPSRCTEYGVVGLTGTRTTRRGQGGTRRDQERPSATTRDYWLTTTTITAARVIGTGTGAGAGTGARTGPVAGLTRTNLGSHGHGT